MFFERASVIDHVSVCLSLRRVFSSGADASSTCALCHLASSQWVAVVHKRGLRFEAAMTKFM